MADATGMDPEFASKLGALINASGGKIWINSGFRSTERQSQLYDAAVQKYGSPEAARKYVAPPGHSNHNFGLAADLGGDLKLAHSLAPQFGLVFPMSWEAWHIEPPWARSARGDDYKNSLTTPPPGAPDASAPDAQLGTLEHQLGVFQSIVKGEDVSAYMDPAGATAPASGAAPSGESGAAGGTEGAVDPAALYKALRAQGVDAVHAAALVGIAGRESSYKTSAHNPNRATGDDSWGLFQINLLNGMHSNYSPQDLSTMEGSAKAAAQMVQGGGLEPWGPYKGVSWAQGVDLDTAAAASGGEVTLADLQGISNEGLR